MRQDDAQWRLRRIGMAACLGLLVAAFVTPEWPILTAEATIGAFTTEADSFEDEDLLDGPSADWYSDGASGSGGIFVSDKFAYSGTQSLRVSGGTGSTAANFVYSPISGTVANERCNAHRLEVAFRVEDFTGFNSFGSPIIQWQSLDTAVQINAQVGSGSNRVELQVRADGTVDVETMSSNQQGTAQNLGSNVVITPGVWERVEIVPISCGQSIFEFRFFEAGYVATIDGVGSLINSADDDGHTLRKFSLVAPVAGSTVYFDVLKARVSGGPPPGSISEGQSVALGTNVVNGYDIDESGTNVIVRIKGALPSGNPVRTYNAKTLNLQGGPQDTNCDRLEGVMATRQATAYVACLTDGSNDVEWLKIRSPNLGDPPFPEDCPDCQKDLTLSTLIDNEDIVGQLVEVQPFPITHENQATTIIGDNVAFTTIAIFFTDTQGRIGLAAKQVRADIGPVQDRQALYTIDFTAPGSKPEQICAYPAKVGDENRVLVVGVGALVDTRAYWAQVSAGDDHLDVSLPLMWTASAAYAQGIAVGCSWDKALVATLGGRVGVIDALTGQEEWAITGVSTKTRGVSLSSDGKFGVVVDGTKARVFDFRDLANVTEVGEISPLPTAQFLGIDMDRHAGQIHHFTVDGFKRYESWNVTTGKAVPTSGDAQPSDGSSADGGAPASGGGGGTGVSIGGEDVPEGGLAGSQFDGLGGNPIFMLVASLLTIMGCVVAMYRVVAK